MINTTPNQIHCCAVRVVGASPLHMNSAKLISIALPEEQTTTKLNINSDTTVGQVTSILLSRPAYADAEATQFGIALQDDQTIVFSGDTKISKIPAVSHVNKPN